LAIGLLLHQLNYLGFLLRN